MVLADFEINVELKPPRSVRVVVYSDHRHLRQASTRYDNVGRRRGRRQKGRFGDTLGICHRFEWRNEKGESKPQCAIVRLAKPNIGVGLISHEMAHAAVWIRQLNGDERPLTTKNDEPFAWLLGELVRQTINTMRDKELFDED